MKTTQSSDIINILTQFTTRKRGYSVCVCVWGGGYANITHMQKKEVSKEKTQKTHILRHTC